MSWGKLARWNDERGFGFIQPDAPPHDDVFVHRKVFLGAGIEPAIGMALEFESVEAEHGPRAASVKRLRSWDDPEAYDDAPVAGMITGRVAHIDTGRNFAFVASDDSGARTFCKLNELGRNGVPEVIGTPVLFEIGERGGRRCVVAIEPLALH
ncbi:cold shock CspA family protein [Bradyrhizobium elkanii]|nr:cold shock CspA family protein [Bradyrhizobium elkanii]